ncbi:glycosyltransferase family 2 protein [Sphingobacterium olei]|uniref:Glycosyltransferase family 2 protein n=1 Tax=Sphingobacterium olei TaxID=2571155 RepID=A0A4U0P062_9SPHI|nr:glycosyltransferase family 2 protein [Sphingobacterium olei]TJZ59882.1 glycosyltransferase family 2 protein [Sphingobacterium olei]
MTTPCVSIIIPIYKAEEYLPQCIDSILSQTFDDFEVLLIDDGSPDKSGELCDEYAAKDDRIRVFHKENTGVSSSRNLGLSEARGKWVTFIDSDDWINADYLKKLMLYAQLDIQIVLGGYKKQSLRVQQIFTSGNDLNYSKADIHLFFQDFISTYIVRTVWGGLYLSSIIKNKEIYFDETLAIGEDTIFNFIYINAIDGSLTVSKTSNYNWRRVEGAESLSQNLNIEGWYKYIDTFYPMLILHVKECQKSSNIKEGLVADCCTLVFMLYRRGYVRKSQLERVYSFLPLVSGKVNIQPLRGKGTVFILIGLLFKYSKSTAISHFVLKLSFFLLMFKQNACKGKILRFA